MSSSFYIGKADTSGIKRTRPRKKPPICTIDGCEKERVARGYCQAHYMSFKRNGSPYGKIIIKKTKVELTEDEILYLIEETTSVELNDIDEIRLRVQEKMKNAIKTLKG
jgi:hypothetical protein